MTSTKKALIPMLIVFIFSVGGVLLLQHFFDAGDDDHVRPGIGEVIPDFEIERFRGEKKLLSAFNSKLILINFWASWCGPCLIEMPSIEKLYERYREAGLAVVFLNIDENPDEVIPDVVSQLGLRVPVYLDREFKMAEHFEVHGIPVTLIIDKERKLLLRFQGERDWDSTAVRSRVERWLESPAS